MAEEKDEFEEIPVDKIFYGPNFLYEFIYNHKKDNMLFKKYYESLRKLIQFTLCFFCYYQKHQFFKLSYQIIIPKENIFSHIKYFLK